MCMDCVSCGGLQDSPQGRCLDLLHRALAPDPSMRISAAEVCGLLNIWMDDDMRESISSSLDFVPDPERALKTNCYSIQKMCQVSSALIYNTLQHIYRHGPDGLIVSLSQRLNSQTVCNVTDKRDCLPKGCFHCQEVDRWTSAQSINHGKYQQAQAQREIERLRQS